MVKTRSVLNGRNTPGTLGLERFPAFVPVFAVQKKVLQLISEITSSEVETQLSEAKAALKTRLRMGAFHRVILISLVTLLIMKMSLLIIRGGVNRKMSALIIMNSQADNPVLPGWLPHRGEAAASSPGFPPPMELGIEALPGAGIQPHGDPRERHGRFGTATHKPQA